MRIAHYSPNPFHRLFENHTDGYEFLDGVCDDSVDIVYVGSVSQLGRAISDNKIFKKPLICWLWDLPLDYDKWGMDNIGMKENRGRGRKIKKTIDLLKQCDLIISASKQTQSVLRNRCGLDSRQMYFYIDIDKLDSVSCSNKTNSIIQISRYFYNKRFEDSIRSCDNYVLNCIGSIQSNHYYEYLQTLISDKTTLHVSLSDNETVGLLKKSRLLVSPSVFEGFGLTPIEAIYCGVPVLLSDIPIFREIWGDYYVPYHQCFDVNEMKSQISNILGSRSLQEEIVEGARPRITEFTPQKFAVRWKELIETL